MRKGQRWKKITFLSTKTRTSSGRPLNLLQTGPRTVVTVFSTVPTADLKGPEFCFAYSYRFDTNTKVWIAAILTNPRCFRSLFFLSTVTSNCRQKVEYQITSLQYLQIRWNSRKIQKHNFANQPRSWPLVCLCRDWVGTEIEGVESWIMF